jgi:phosphoribosylaminoimidazole-succinocarboxamide synthase
MEAVLKGTNFKFPGQTGFVKGELIDFYYLNHKVSVEIYTDRVVINEINNQYGVPYLGQLITRLGNKLMPHASGYFNFSDIKYSELNVVIRRKNNNLLKVYIGDYLNGDIWNEYKAGKRLLNNINLDNDLKKDTKLENQIILFYIGNDSNSFSNIAIDDILNDGFIKKTEDIDLFLNKVRALYKTGKSFAEKAGYVLAGASYLFCKNSNELLLADFIHTPNNAIYYEYEKTNPVLVKENLYLYEYFEEIVTNLTKNKKYIKNFVPKLDSQYFEDYSVKCFDLYKKLTGEVFIPLITNNLTSIILKNIHNFLIKHSKHDTI